ncbi:MAG: DUF692 family multinuclear iron-containing protein [Anaerolineae bacterium]
MIEINGSKQTAVKLAVNYSAAAGDLLKEGLVHIDCFKCPAWPDLITSVREIHPLYVHFPLKVGTGIGDAVDTETKQLADWNKVEQLLTQTETPLVNVHFSASQRDYPDVPPETNDPAHIEMVVEKTVRDVESVIRRFGRDLVILENLTDDGDRNLRLSYSPEVITQVVEAAGCGFLFDVSHARLAANRLGVDAKTYMQSLPVQYTREIHVTGIQRFNGRWADIARSVGLAEEEIERFSGRLVDHLPFTEDDWTFMTWALGEVHAGRWGRPWVVAFEYGGVGGVFAAATDRAALAEQLPQLKALVQGSAMAHAA